MTTEEFYEYMISLEDNKQDIVIAWAIAILVHVLFFILSGKMFIKPSQFAIAPSHEIDINLIDEPKEVIKVQEQLKPVINKAEKMAEKPKQLVAPKHLIIPKQIITTNAHVKIEAKPDYIQNPPPPYPELAKQMRQEGLVLLKVDVNSQGLPIKIDILKSSGFQLLDQAAFKAVSHWKFQPGRMGDLPVESTVTVPIKFRLEQ